MRSLSELGVKPEKPTWQLNFNLTDYATPDEIAANLFMLYAAENSFRIASSFTIKTNVSPGQLIKMIENEPNWEHIWSYSSESKTESHLLVMRPPNSGDILTYISKRESFLQVWLSSNDTAQIEAASMVLKESFPTPVIKREITSVPINFWSFGPRAPIRREEKVKPLLWKEIAKNYSDKTRQKLQDIVKISPPIDGGRIILFHGPAGTGKTSAIRSFIYESLPWCDASYIVDPEVFFGNAEYMLQVLLGQNDDYNYFDEEDQMDLDHEQFYALQGKDRWRLLIVEDADEFLKGDAQEKMGQSMSRLLNIADGLIGQSLNFLILITTNAQIQDINKAVAREGRCLANVHFSALSRSEAVDWLDGLEVQLPSGSEFSLAQLYNLKHATKQIKLIDTNNSIGVYL